MAEQISYLTQKHQLLPVSHLRGRPGHMTMDSLHLLKDTIKAAWRCKQMALVFLFLDVEGAFPNAVKGQLLHNLKNGRIPEIYIMFIDNPLMGRRTKLKFDDHILDWFSLDNGIGQGDPLSMVLYLYYNTDLLDLAKGRNELVLGYVDNVALVEIAKMFSQTHTMLKDMVGRKGSGLKWVVSHNSKFKTSKSVIVNFSSSN